MEQCDREEEEGEELQLNIEKCVRVDEWTFIFRVK